MSNEKVLFFLKSKGIDEATIKTKEGFMMLSSLISDFNDVQEEMRDIVHKKAYDSVYKDGYQDGAFGKPKRKDLGKYKQCEHAFTQNHSRSGGEKCIKCGLVQ